MDKTFYILADVCIAGIVVVACLIYLAVGIQTEVTKADGTVETKTGIYEVLGDVPTIEEADDNIHKTPDKVTGALTSEPPIVTYNNQILKTHQCEWLKDLFSITINGVTYRGTEETLGGFKIVIEEVINSSGRNVLTIADYDITQEIQDGSIKVLYNKMDETITFYEPDAYKIRIKVTDSNGKTSKVTVAVPVEIEF